MLINSSLLRLTWTAIEEVRSIDLLSLTDTGLVKFLLQHVSRKILLTGEEVCALYEYLSLKITLIRDLAESRFAVED